MIITDIKNQEQLERIFAIIYPSRVKIFRDGETDIIRLCITEQLYFKIIYSRSTKDYLIFINYVDIGATSQFYPKLTEPQKVYDRISSIINLWISFEEIGLIRSNEEIEIIRIKNINKKTKQ